MESGSGAVPRSGVSRHHHRGGSSQCLRWWCPSLIKFSNYGLSSVKQGVLTFFHETYHHYHFNQTGVSGGEIGADAYADRMWARYGHRFRDFS